MLATAFTTNETILILNFLPEPLPVASNMDARDGNQGISGARTHIQTDYIE